MREPATTLTDFLLALLTGIAMVRLLRSPGVAVSLGAPLFFGAFAAAAVWGGVWHGWFSAATSLTQQVIWWLSMLSAAGAAAGLALLGFELFSVRNRRSIMVLLAVGIAIFGIVAWHDPRFLLVVLATAIGTLICCAGLLNQMRRGKPQAAGVALIGLVGSVLAGVAQQSGLALRPPAFDHNATYHVLLIPALSLFYVGLTRLFGDSQSAVSRRRG